MPPRSTDSFRTSRPGADRATGQWTLAIALDCQRLDTVPTRHVITAYATVEIGRGDARSVRPDGDRLRIDLDDSRASQIHARIERTGEQWIANDAGSKNGTRINGKLVKSAPLGNGDVLECGNTFFVLRHAVAGRALPDAAALADMTLSPAFERELSPLPKIARSRVPVLVRGETGTGKEGIAAAIHRYSHRNGPLINVNCAAIPPTLLESELFGSKRGAFSGAEDRPGLIRNADRGTLFLDEVAELPLVSQAALLRFLQEGEVMVVGSGKPVIVDVRVVAATNRTVEELVGNGTFRRDLYARLRGYEVRLPPLRDRIEDLGLLIATLLARHDPGGAPRTLSRTAARALFLHEWPFNVRELEQALRTAIAIASSPEIELGDLRLERRSEDLPGDATRAKLIELLTQHDGNISAVARELATSRTQIQRLCTRHDIDPHTYKRNR